MLVSATAANAQAATLGGTVTIGTAAGFNPGTNNSLSIALTGLKAIGSSSRYEGWLVKADGTKVSVGVFSTTSITRTWKSPTDENLAAQYVQMLLTLEPFPDPDPATAGPVQYAATFKSGVLIPFRNLLASSTVTATGNGIGQAIYGQAKIAQQHAVLSRDSTSLALMQTHAQHVINVVDGLGGPGDGKGLIYYANQAIAEANAAKAAAATTDTTVIAGADDVIVRANRVIEKSLAAKENADALLNATSLNILTDAYSLSMVDSADRVVTASTNLLKASQAMGAYKFVAGPAGELPSAGDDSVPALAMMALLAGIVLTSGGFLTLRRRQAVV
jgi:LPXTG-motif cell wall-anchored protein